MVLSQRFLLGEAVNEMAMSCSAALAAERIACFAVNEDQREAPFDQQHDLSCVVVRLSDRHFSKPVG